MWFNILKVDFDFKSLPKNQIGEYDSNTDKITIDEKGIYEYLKEKGKTTDEEIIDYLLRIVNHEVAHAAHNKADDKFHSRFKSQKEYIAFALENLADPMHLRLLNFVNHPDVFNTARGRKIKEILQEATNQDLISPEEYVKARLRIKGMIRNV
tara:strand:+ start:117 stop:575 length:459 start_codon:yes stop_codon:yes gene_type:complete